jgi:hypothetical protein
LHGRGWNGPATPIGTARSACTNDDDFLRLVAARGWRARLVRPTPGHAGQDAVLAARVSCADRLHAAFADPEVGGVVNE